MAKYKLINNHDILKYDRILRLLIQNGYLNFFFFLRKFFFSQCSQDQMQCSDENSKSSLNPSWVKFPAKNNDNKDKQQYFILSFSSKELKLLTFSDGTVCSSFITVLFISYKEYVLVFGLSETVLSAFTSPSSLGFNCPTFLSTEFLAKQQDATNDLILFILRILFLRWLK